MNHEGRALTEDALLKIQKDIFLGLYNDTDINRMFESLFLQRKILRALFNLFRSEPLSRVSIADPVRNSTLAHFKYLVSMEDRQMPE